MLCPKAMLIPPFVKPIPKNTLGRDLRRKEFVAGGRGLRLRMGLETYPCIGELQVLMLSAYA